MMDRLIVLYPPEKDRKLEKLFKIFDFIQLSHLECKQDVIISSSFEQALKRVNIQMINCYLIFLDLHKVDDYKTPRDKVISIINCCKIVSSLN